jgi:hypothetical protein
MKSRIDLYVIYIYIGYRELSFKQAAKSTLVLRGVRLWLDMQDAGSCLSNKNVKLSFASVHAELIEYRLRVL